MEDIALNMNLNPTTESHPEMEKKVSERSSKPKMKRKMNPSSKFKLREEKYLKSLEDNPEDQKSRDVFSSSKFDELPICEKIKIALNDNSYSIMTHIQRKAIPTILQNKYVMVKSETGSGKTFAYLVPILQKLYEHSIKSEDSQIKREKGTYVLIFSPTRELAVQIYESCMKLIKRMSFIICGALMGGESVQHEKARLRKGLNIVVTTPGRFLYHMQNTKAFQFSNLQYLVFDEADRILDMGFEKEIKACISTLKSSLQEKFQDLAIVLAAATTGGKLTNLVENIMNSYVSVGFETETDTLVQVPHSIHQLYSIIPLRHRIQLLFAFLYCKKNSKIILFVSTCQCVNFFYDLIKELDWSKYEGPSMKLFEKYFFINK